MESSGDKNVPKETSYIPNETEKTDSFFCYACSKTFTVHGDHDFNYICIYCGGEFLEEIEEEDDPRNFTPFDGNTQNQQNDQANSNTTPTNPQNNNISNTTSNNNTTQQNNNSSTQNNIPRPTQTLGNLLFGNHNVGMQQTTTNNGNPAPRAPQLSGATIITGGNTNVQIIHTSFNVPGSQPLSLNNIAGIFFYKTKFFRWN